MKPIGQFSGCYTYLFFCFDLIINRKFQLAKKVVSGSLGWILLLNSVLNLTKGQIKFFGQCSQEIFFCWGQGGGGVVKNDVLTGTTYHISSCKTVLGTALYICNVYLSSINKD